jgi:hypothetical protein
MGYTTIFEGKFEFDKPLDVETFNILNGLTRTRRMKRDPRILEQLGYGNAESFGVDGEFFIEGKFRDFRCPSIISGNEPPITQPGLWLKWEPTEDRKYLVWNGAGKFYNAEHWICYLIEKVLEPRGYSLNGVVNAQGEDDNDKWNIRVVNNSVLVGKGFDSSAPLPVDYDKWAEERYQIK